MATNQQAESFHQFYDYFLHQQKQFLHHLISASSSNRHHDHHLQPLINQVIEHYEQYYESKSKWAKLDILAMFSPSWTSSLEDAFLWIGGWRPSTAFHLLYSASGLQLQAQFHDIISGLTNGNLADLSPTQLSRIDGFQRQVIKEERKITEEMAKHQETVADSSMVELSNVVSNMKNIQDVGSSNSSIDIKDAELIEKQVESTLAPKEQGLEGILQKADDLRLTAIKGIVEILNPLQAVHFLIALAQLHLRFHEWGNEKDAKLTT